MDIATHALTSYVLARGFFPRRHWPLAIGMLFAGMVADIDFISAFWAPAAYFATRRTYTDSILGTIVIVLIAIVFTIVLSRKPREGIGRLVLPLALAAVVHVTLDVCQSEGVALFWPFQHRRFAMDWLPSIDPWILALLACGVFVPELFRLVSSEIGAKDKTPRGRNGALVAIVLIIVYVGARAVLHTGSISLLGAHSYHGESPHRVGAFPDPLSIATWHGVVETASYICLAEVPVGPGRSFDPESADCLHKPEATPVLDAAQKSRVAQEYLEAVPFPRAIVASTQLGYEVEIRSMRDIAESERRHRVAAVIFVDKTFTVSKQEFVWVRELRLR